MKNFIAIVLLAVLVTGCSGAATPELSSSSQESIAAETASTEPEDASGKVSEVSDLQVQSGNAQPVLSQVHNEQVVNTTAEPVIGKPNYVSGVLDYNAVQYAEAVANKQDVVLDFHADWCHVCRDNEPIIRSAVSDLNKPDLVVFIVDYDNAKDLRREFNVVTQTTLIMIPSGDTTKQTRFIGPLSKEKATELFTF